MLGRAVTFDFSGPPPAADYLVDGLLERGTITVLSADSGAGKSLIAASMAVAMMQSRPWLGRRTTGKRVMFIDEENFYRVIFGRLLALGMTNEDRQNLLYFLRLGVALGSGDWMERVREEMDDFHPDLLVVDTAAAATNVELNDNSAVARLYATSLRPLVDDAGMLLLHHERKPQGSYQRHAGHAMMGARQWAGQADSHLALERLGDVAVEALSDGRMLRRYPLKMEMPKNRDGRSVNEKIAIVSEHNPGSTQPTWLRVDRVGRGDLT